MGRGGGWGEGDEKVGEGRGEGGGGVEGKGEREKCKVRTAGLPKEGSCLMGCRRPDEKQRCCARRHGKTPHERGGVGQGRTDGQGPPNAQLEWPSAPRIRAGDQKRTWRGRTPLQVPKGKSNANLWYARRRALSPRPACSV